MKILIINAGSSSLKFQLFEQNEQKKNTLKNTAKKNTKGALTLLYKGHIDELGQKNCRFHEKLFHFDPQNDRNYRSMKEIPQEQAIPCPVKNFGEAIAWATKKMLEHGLLQSFTEIKAIGHRVVHGGEYYREPVVITSAVLRTIKKLCELAPLHNPANLEAIEACQKIFKSIPQIAVFDTAFHQTIPPKAFLYALPYAYYQQLKVRRYGFHGISHRYVSQQASALLKSATLSKKSPLKSSRIIVCHLGNGSSISAIANGKSIDTSMGFTPLEGIPMGTRSGDLDPAIIFYLLEKLKCSPTEIASILNHESGLKGLSEMSSDMRTLWEAAQKKTPKTFSQKQQAERAMAVLAYRIAKYIGGYTAALGGLDALVFTGGIGENAYYLRDKVCSYFDYLQLELDPRKNRSSQIEIHSSRSKIKVYVIPTDEEKQIALELLTLKTSTHQPKS